MTDLRNAVLLREVHALFGFGVTSEWSDQRLLDQFLTGGQFEAEAAFTLLVERHGPMVWRVCRQVLADSNDAEDAFQATFLVFLRRAGSIRKHKSLASWLFGVATRVARRAREDAIARRYHERKAAEVAVVPGAALDEHAECRAALQEEIARLPERYRAPIVLCRLEGLSTAAAAERLGCAQGTILSRLARGRARLRRRMAQRIDDALVRAHAAVRDSSCRTRPACLDGEIHHPVRGMQADGANGRVRGHLIRRRQACRRRFEALACDQNRACGRCACDCDRCRAVHAP